MIEYRDSILNLAPEELTGFFEDWPNRPDPETHLRILRGSFAILLAFDTEKGRVVGSELVRRLLERLSDLYMVDLTCDTKLAPFYETFGMSRLVGMARRSYENQCGRRV